MGNSVARSFFAVAVVAVMSIFGAALWKKAFRCPVRQLAGKFPEKTLFVELNGGVGRLVGRRMCNERMLRKDGMLDYLYARKNAEVDSLVEAVSQFDKRVRELGCAFLYVQAPPKMPVHGDVMPEGWESGHPAERACRVVDGLKRRGVRTLDLVPEFSATEADVARNFFRTDHHWRPTAAFRAAQLLAGELSQMLKDPALRNPRQLDMGNWDCKVRRRCFLGSHGRRTGRLFSGLDDFELLVPKFDTDISRAVASGRVMRGRFEESVLKLKAMSRKSLHTRNLYGVYGGDFGEMLQVNHAAPSAARVLMVKDSFANPVAAFLATVCSEVVVVDPRRLDAPGDVMALLVRHRPDVVVELVNPGSFNNGKYKFGLSEERR